MVKGKDSVSVFQRFLLSYPAPNLVKVPLSDFNYTHRRAFRVFKYQKFFKISNKSYVEYIYRCQTSYSVLLSVQNGIASVLQWFNTIILLRLDLSFAMNNSAALIETLLSLHFSNDLRPSTGLRSILLQTATEKEQLIS